MQFREQIQSRGYYKYVRGNYKPLLLYLNSVSAYRVSLFSRIC